MRQHSSYSELNEKARRQRSGIQSNRFGQTKCSSSVTATQGKASESSDAAFPSYAHSLRQLMTFVRLDWNLRLLPARVVNGVAG